MKMAIAKEIDPSEPRVAASPDTVKKFKAIGAEVVIEPGAGIKSGLPDSEFTAVGATVSADALKDADIIIQVKRPEASELSQYKRGALVIAIMDPYGNEAALKTIADAGVAAFAMELMPRITRAQVMDVLSSQANLAGYRAVIEAAEKSSSLSSCACRPLPAAIDGCRRAKSSRYVSTKRANSADCIGGAEPSGVRQSARTTERARTCTETTGGRRRQGRERCETRYLLAIDAFGPCHPERRPLSSRAQRGILGNWGQIRITSAEMLPQRQNDVIRV
jgi:hypothetical protein